MTSECDPICPQRRMLNLGQGQGWKCRLYVTTKTDICALSSIVTSMMDLTLTYKKESAFPILTEIPKLLLTIIINAQFTSHSVYVC